jgi:cytochrome c55X
MLASMKWPIPSAAALLLSTLALADLGAPDAARQRQLLHLVSQDCGSCHGMRLTGGLGLPLTAEALRDKPVEGLEATVYYGRPGTAMPPWKSFLSESEVHWIVQQLMTGFTTE